MTPDLLGNYKDNVKKGDPLPLIGVIPKPSMSSQDFIVSKNQIIQQLNSAKVVNKIKVAVLNPDLTAPFGSEPGEQIDPDSYILIVELFIEPG